MVTITSRNPFDLPELRHRLSRFVTIKDALSRPQPSSRFADLSPAIVTKHGHLIRIVKNAKALPQVLVLANANANQLRSLQIKITATALQYVHGNEIISRNSASIETLDISATSVPTIKRVSPVHYLSASVLVPFSGTPQVSPSKLKVLRIRNTCLTHDGLVAILQVCTRLTELRLSKTDIFGRPTRSFQHTGVTLLYSPLKQLFPPEPAGPSFLSYFPNLITFATSDFDDSFVITTNRIKEDLSRYCPLVTGYRLEDHTGAIVPSFCTNIATNPPEIVFLHKHTSLETITAILLHQATIKTIMAFYMQHGFDHERDEVASVSDHFQASGQFLQLIPRCCSQLKTLDLHFHEMDMDVVEMGVWACKDLTTLQIRVKGLDTKDKILKAIALWRAGCWRRWQERATGVPIVMEEQDKTDLLIEARVARHLLKFEKLWTVWLGYQTWTPI
ncbi:hypothetical protein BGX33_009816 [Mortierella sp. NVP41]|nr:hypothetical protein BGX33_009816 [Mortierella sp. NVP41]